MVLTNFRYAELTILYMNVDLKPWKTHQDIIMVIFLSDGDAKYECYRLEIMASYENKSNYSVIYGVGM